MLNPKVRDVYLAHARYFRDLLDELDEQFASGRQPTALSDLDLHFENVQRAFEWCTEHADDDETVALIGSRFPNAGPRILRLRLSSEEQEHWLETQESLCRRVEDREGRAVALGNLGALAREQGQLDRAWDLTKASLEILRELGHDDHVAAQTANLGLIEVERGNLESAERILRDSLDTSRRLGLDALSANQLCNLGTVCAEGERLDEAGELFEQALALGERRGFQQVVAEALANLSKLSQESGALSHAAELAERALAVSRVLGNTPQVVAHAIQLAEIEALRGDDDRARELRAEAEALAASHGVRR